MASFFLSRIDTKVDDRLQERMKRIGSDTLNEEKRLESVKGKVAIANAKVALPNLPIPVQRRPLAAPGRQWGQRAAPALGQHQHQKPRLQRRALCG